MQKFYATILQMSQLLDMLLCLVLKINTDLNQPLLVAIYEALAGKEEYLSVSPACQPCYFSQDLAILICPTNLSARQRTAALNFSILHYHYFVLTKESCTEGTGIVLGCI